MLTNRERFWRTMRFEEVDRLPYWVDCDSDIEALIPLWVEEG